MSRRVEALALFRELGYRRGVAAALVSLGRVLRVQGRAAESRERLEQALALSHDLGSADGIVLASCGLAALADGDVTEALAAFDELRARAAQATAMEAHFLLWMATHDAAHLTEANRLLDYLVEHAPEEYRESMRKNVRLHREIVEAWESSEPA